MYLKLINDKFYESTVYVKEPDNIAVDVNFLRGRLITQSLVLPIVYTTNGKSGDEVRDFLDTSYPLMSKRFVELLRAGGVDNLQLFPAVIKSEVDGSVWEDYYAVNVLGLIACADMDNSDYDEIMPGHYRFRELAIQAEKANDALLFRLQEDATIMVIQKSVGQFIRSQDPDKKLKGWSVGKIIQ
ncbi:MAG: hypothetical protein B0W54_15320 [Cellvibrio sp. 79]|nr:MAG: hypothetical protein B0W54_15320 [Cellvibrio sp. 79]